MSLADEQRAEIGDLRSDIGNGYPQSQPSGSQQASMPTQSYSAPVSTPSAGMSLANIFIIIIGLIALTGLVTGSVALADNKDSGSNTNTVSADFVTGQTTTGTSLSQQADGKYIVNLDYTITESTSYIQFLNGVSGDGQADASRAVVLDTSRGISGLGTVRANQFYGNMGDSGTSGNGYFSILQASDLTTLDGGLSIKGSFISGEITGSNANVASGANSLALAGKRNTVSGVEAGNVAGSSNTIAAGADYSVIAGGVSNQAYADMAFVAGGFNNSASGASSAVVGGYDNSVSGFQAVNVAGTNNEVSGFQSGNLAGPNNEVSGNQSGNVAGASNTVVGVGSGNLAGSTNRVNGNESGNVAGDSNTVSGNRSANLAGNSNSVTGANSANLSGQNNTIATGADYSVIAGGVSNQVYADTVFVAGGYNNSASGVSSAIVGGNNNIINATDSSNCGIFAGNNNEIIGATQGRSVVLGGQTNNIQGTASYHSVIAGGQGSSIAGTASRNSGIIGGYQNKIEGTESFQSFIAGGGFNIIAGTASRNSGIIGGNNNIINSQFTFIGGGEGLSTQGGSSWNYTSLVGRYNNYTTYPWDESIAQTLPGTCYRFIVGSGDSTTGNNAFVVDDEGNLYFGTTTGASIYQRTATNEYTAKAFTIQHPTVPNKWLRHGCLEGPEGGVYYRGKGEAPATIRLPDYATHIASDFTVQVTPIGSPRMMSASEVSPEGTFRVYGEGKFHWTAIGERVPLEPEPFKSDVSIHSMGPYSWSV